jgi:arylformamidase
MYTDVQGDLKLTAADVAANSPLNLPLHFDAPVICAVGGAESGDFRNQSKDFVDKCKKHDLDCEYFELDGDNHFDAVERLADADHPLTRAVLVQMGLS